MVDKEKIKLEIEKMKLNREYLMFQYSNVNSIWLGSVAILIAVFIPVIVILNKVFLIFLAAGVLILLLYIIQKIVAKIYLKRLEDVLKCLNCRLNEKYKLLGVSNE